MRLREAGFISSNEMNPTPKAQELIPKDKGVRVVGMHPKAGFQKGGPAYGITREPSHTYLEHPPGRKLQAVLHFA